MKRHLASTFLLLALSLAAIYTGKAVALQVVSRSYSVAPGSVISAGNLVSTTGGQQEVVLANTDNNSRLVGVVVPANESTVAINGSAGQDTVQVANTGTCSVYVSTIEGDIHAGDAIAVSPLSGIGMKAQGTLKVIGVAQADFSASTVGAKPYMAEDKSGKAHQVVIGSIPITIGIGDGIGLAMDAGVVGNLQATAGAIVGHPVSALQAILAFLVAIIAVGSLVALVYGSIKAGVGAIGRNPLAKGSIYKSLAQVIAMACLIVVIAGAVLYFTLR